MRRILSWCIALAVAAGIAFGVSIAPVKVNPVVTVAHADWSFNDGWSTYPGTWSLKRALCAFFGADLNDPACE